MSFTTENLLYLTTAFQPTASYKKSSFIDFHCHINHKPYHISFARDSMGLGWIQTNKPFPKDGKITGFQTMPVHYDQTFSNWFPIQLHIDGRSGRHNVLRAILQSCLNASEGEIHTFCISRLAVFKEESGALNYNWEVIDGRDPGVIAEHTGDPAQLLTGEYTQRKMLMPPVRVGANANVWKKKGDKLLKV